MITIKLGTYVRDRRRGVDRGKGTVLDAWDIGPHRFVRVDWENGNGLERSSVRRIEEIEVIE